MRRAGRSGAWVVLAVPALLLLASPTAAQFFPPPSPFDVPQQGELGINFSLDPPPFVIGQSVFVPAGAPETAAITYENIGGRAAPIRGFHYISSIDPSFDVTCFLPVIQPSRATGSCSTTLVFPASAIPPGETTVRFPFEFVPFGIDGDIWPFNDTTFFNNVFLVHDSPVLQASIDKVVEISPGTFRITTRMTNTGFETAVGPAAFGGLFRFRMFRDNKSNPPVFTATRSQLIPGESVVQIVEVTLPTPGPHNFIAVADPFYPTWSDDPADGPQGRVGEAFDTAFNVASVRLPFVVPPAICDTFADLVAERLEILPDTAFGPNDTFTIRLTTFNRGNIPAEFPNPDSPNVIAFLLDGEGLAAVETSTTVPVDSAFIVTATIPPLGREGVFEVRARVDALGHLFQGCPDVTGDGTLNDAISRLLIVGRVADLEVRSEEIEFVPAAPDTLGATLVRARVRNVGDTPVFNAVVELYEGVTGGDPRAEADPTRFVERFVLPRLDPGAAFTVEALHQFREGETHAVLVIADPAGGLREPWENNNRATRAVFISPPAPAIDTRSIDLSNVGWDVAGGPTSKTVTAGEVVRIAGAATYSRVWNGTAFVGGRPAEGVPVRTTARDVTFGAVGATASARTEGKIGGGGLGHDLVAPSVPDQYDVVVRVDDHTLFGERTLTLIVDGFDTGVELLVDPRSLEAVPAPVEAGTPTTLRVRVRNVGKEAPGADVPVVFSIDGVAIETAFVRPIGSGGESVASVSVPAGLAAGTRRLKADAASGGAGDALSNNVAETAVVVASSAADLRPVGVRFEPVRVIEDRPETVTVTIENIGATAADNGGGGVPVRIVADGGRFDTVVRTAGAVGAFGGTADVTVVGVVYQRAGAETLLAVANPTGAVADADRSNDSLLVSVAVRSDTIAPVAEIVSVETPIISPENPGLRGESTVVCYRVKDAVSPRVFVKVRIEDEKTGAVVRTLRLLDEIAESPVVHCDTWDGRNDSGLFAPQGRYRFAILPSDPAGNLGRADTRIVVDNFGIEAEILSPFDGEVIADTPGGAGGVEVVGNARGPRFESYAVILLDSQGVTLALANESTVAETAGFLAFVPFSGLPSDTYRIRLVVFSIAGETVADEVRFFLSRASRIALPDSIVVSACDLPSVGRFRARAFDASGGPVEGVRIAFSISAPDLVIPDSSVTGADGFTETAAVVAGNRLVREAVLAAAVPGAAPPVVETTVVRFVAGRPDAIVVTATPAEIRADGISTSDVAVTVLDRCGNPVEGETVVLSLAPETGTLSATTVVSVSPSVAVRYTAPVLRADSVVRIGARLPARPFVKAETVAVTLIGDAARLVIYPERSPDIVEVDLGETAALRLAAVNLDGRELAGESVEVRIDSDAGAGRLFLAGVDEGESFVAVTAVQGAGDPPPAGVSFEFLAGFRAGVETVVGRSLRTPGLEETQVVRVLPGPPVRLDVAVFDTPRANTVDTARIEVAAFDTFGNPVPGVLYRIDLDTVLHGGFDGPPPFASVLGRTGPDGRDTRVFTSTTTPGTAVTSAEAVDFGLVDSAPVVVVRPPPTSIVFATDRRNLRLDRSETTAARVTVTDEFGNLLTGVEVRFETQVVTFVGGETLATAAGLGETVIAALGPGAGRDTVVARALENPAVADTRVVCAVGPVTGIVIESAPLVDFSVGVPAGLRRAGLTVTLRDAQGCLVPRERVRLRLSEAGVVRTDTDDLTTTDDGRATATLLWETKAGTVLLTASLPDAGLEETVPVTIKPAKVDTVIVTAIPGVIFAGGPETSVVTAEPRDAFGNAFPGREIRFANANAALGGYVTPTTVTTDSTGRARAAYDDLGIPGTDLLTAEDVASGKRGSARIRILGEIAKIEFRPAEVTLTANGESVVQAAIVALDSAGQAMPGETIVLEPDTATNPAHPRGPFFFLSETTVVSGADGRAVFDVRAGTVAVDALLGARSARKPSLVAEPLLLVRLLPGPPARLDLVPAFETAVANQGIARFEAHITDTFGNVVPGTLAGPVDFTYAPIGNRSIVDADFLARFDAAFGIRDASETPVMEFAVRKVAGEKRITAVLASDTSLRDTATLDVEAGVANAVIVERRFTVDQGCFVTPVIPDCPDIVVRRGEEGFLDFEVVDPYGNLVADERVILREPPVSQRVGSVLVPDTRTDDVGRARLAFRGETLGLQTVEIEAPDARGVFRVIYGAQVWVVPGIPEIRGEIGRATFFHEMILDTFSVEGRAILKEVRWENRVPVFGTVEDEATGESIAMFLHLVADHGDGFDTMDPTLDGQPSNLTVVYSAPPEAAETGVWGIAPEMTDTDAQFLVDQGLFDNVDSAKASVDTMYLTLTSAVRPRPEVKHTVTVSPLAAKGCFVERVFIDLASAEPDTYRHAVDPTAIGNIGAETSDPPVFNGFSMLLNESGVIYPRREVVMEVLNEESRPYLHFGEADSFGLQTDTLTTDETGVIGWRFHTNAGDLIDSLLAAGDTDGALAVAATLPGGAFEVCIRFTEVQSGAQDTFCLLLGEPGGGGVIGAACRFRAEPEQVIGGCSSPVRLTGELFIPLSRTEIPVGGVDVEFSRTPARGTVLRSLDGAQEVSDPDGVLTVKTNAQGVAQADLITGSEGGIILVTFHFPGAIVNGFALPPTTCTAIVNVLPGKAGIAGIDVPDTVELVYEGEEETGIEAVLLDRCLTPIPIAGHEITFEEGYLDVSETTGFVEPLAAQRPIVSLTNESGAASETFQSGTELRPSYNLVVRTLDLDGNEILERVAIRPRQRVDTLVFEPVDTPIVGGAELGCGNPGRCPAVEVRALDKLGRPVRGDSILFTLLDTGGGVIETVRGLTNDVGIASARFRTGTVAETVFVVAVDTSGPDTPPPKFPVTETLALFVRPETVAAFEVSADPPAVRANGLDTSAVTVVALDRFGNRVPDADFHVSLSAVEAGVIDETGLTGADGSETALFVAGTSYTGKVTVTARRGTVQGTATINLKGAPTTLIVTGKSDEIVAGGEGFIEWQLLDQGGNLVGLEPLEGRDLSGPAALGETLLVTNADGKATGRVLAETLLVGTTKEWVGTALAVVDSGVAAAPCTIPIVPDASRPVFDLTAERARVPAGGETTAVVLSATDIYGNPLEGFEGAFFLEPIDFAFDPFDVSGVSPRVEPRSLVAVDETGLARATFFSGETAGRVNLVGEVLGVDRAETVLTVIAAGAETIAVSVDPERVLADGFSTVEVSGFVRDRFGNAVEGEAVAFRAVEPSDLASTIGAAVTDAAGRAIVFFTPDTPARTLRVAGRAASTGVEDTALLDVLGPPAAIVFDPDPVVVARGGREFVVATVVDDVGNPVPGETVGFAIRDTGLVTFGLPFGNVSDGAGRILVEVRAETRAGTTFIDAADTNHPTPAFGTAEVVVEPGAVDRLVVTAAPETFSLVERDTADVTVLALDADSNPVPGIEVSLSDDAGNLSTLTPDRVVTDASGLATGILLRAIAPARITVTAVTFDELNLPITDTVVVVVTAGPAETIEVRPKAAQPLPGFFVIDPEALVADAAGNPVAGVPVAGFETKTDTNLTFGDGAETVAPTDAAGLAAFDLRLFTNVVVGEAFDVAAFFAETPTVVDTETVVVWGEPASVVVTLSDNLLPADGVSTTGITVTVRDAAGTPVPGEEVALDLLRASDSAVVTGQAGVGLFDDVFDRGDGTYAGRYRAGTVADTYAIRATVRTVFGDTFVVVSPDVTPPPTPDGLRVADVDGFEATVAWNAVDPTDVRRLILTRDGSVVAVLSPSATSFIDTTVVPGKGHAYLLVAEDTVGNASSPQPAPAVLATSLDFAAQALVPAAANVPDALWAFASVPASLRADLEAEALALGLSLDGRTAYRLKTIPALGSLAESIVVRLKPLDATGAAEAYVADTDRAWHRADSQAEDIADVAVKAETTVRHEYWALLGDGTAPTAEIIEPFRGAFVRAAEMTIVGTATDNEAAGFEYRLSWRRGGLSDAGSETLAAVSGTRIEPGVLGTVDLNGGAAGPVTIILRVRDRSGNTAEARREVTVDPDSPVVRIDSPLVGDVRGGTVAVLGEVFDPSGNLFRWTLTARPSAFPDSVAFQVSEAAPRAGLLGEDLEPDRLRRLGLPADADYVIRLTAADRAGQTAETEVVITLDNTPPALLVKPGDTTVGTGDTVVVTALVTDLHDLASATIFFTPIGTAAEVSAPLAGIVPGIGTGRFDLATPFDTVGAIPYRIEAVDIAGNRAVSDTFVVTVVDRDSPVARFVAPSVVKEADIVRFNASMSEDSVGIVVYLWDFGDGETLATTAPVVEHVYPEETGPLTVRLVVRDAAGNADDETAPITVLDVAPIVSLELVPPVFGMQPTFREGDTVLFKVRFEDPGPFDLLFTARLTLTPNGPPIEIPAPGEFVLKNTDYFIEVTLDDMSPGVAAQAIVTEVAPAPAPTGFSNVIDLKVDNDAPPVPAVDLLPDLARTRDDLFTTVNQPPDPGGDVVTHVFEWSVNGVDTPALKFDTVPFTRTKKDDTWAVCVFATDGEDRSAGVCDTVVILNTPPDTPGVRVAPIFRNETEVLSSETMIGIVDTPSQDPDVDDGVDTITYTYVWLKRGDTQAAFTRSSKGLVETGPPPSATLEGETWTLKVFPFDGDDTGPAGVFTVTIVAPPVISPAVPDTFVFRTQTLLYNLTPFETDEEDPAGDGTPLVWSVSGVDPALFSAFSVDPVTDVLSMTARTETGTDTIVLTLTDGRGLTDTQEVRVFVIAPEIDLKIDGLDTESVRRGPPGETVTYVLSVENRARLDDLVAFSFTGIPVGWRARIFDTVAGVEVTGVSLPPFSGRSFALQVFVAADATPTTQGRIRVVGTAIDGITIDSAIAVVVVKAVPRVLVTSLTSNKTSYNLGEAATITWTVKNLTAEALNNVSVTTAVRHLGETVVLAETDVLATLISGQEVTTSKTVPGSQNNAAGTYVVTVTVISEDTELPPLDVETIGYNVGLPAISVFRRTSQSNVVSPGAPGNGDQAKFDLDVTNGGAAVRVRRLVEVRTPEDTLVRTLLDVSDTILSGQTPTPEPATFTVTAADPRGQLNVVARLIRVSDSVILDQKVEVIFNGAVRVNDIRFPGRGGAVPTYVAGETVTVEVEVENLLNSDIPQARIVIEVRDPFGSVVHRDTSAVFVLPQNGKPDTTFSFRLDTVAFQGTYRVIATVDSGGAPQHDRAEDFRVGDFFTITEFRLRVTSEDRDYATLGEITAGQLKATFTVFNNLPASADAFPRVVVTRPAGDTLVISSLAVETQTIGGQASAQWNNQPLNFATAGQGLYTFALEIYDSAGPRVLRTSAARFLDVVRFVRISNVQASPSRFHPRPSLNETTTISYARQVFGDQNAVRAGGETVQIVRPADGAMMRTFFDTYEAYPFVPKNGVSSAQKPNDGAKTWTRVWDGRDDTGDIVLEGAYEIRVIGLGGPVENQDDPMTPVDTHTALGSVTVWGSHEGLHEDDERPEVETPGETAPRLTEEPSALPPPAPSPPFVILPPGTFPPVPSSPPAPAPPTPPAPTPPPTSPPAPVPPPPAPPAPTDTEAPVTTLTADYTDSTGRVLIPWSEVTLTAVDGPAGAASGVASTRLVIDGETVVAYADPVTPAALGLGLGPHTLGYASTDHAGNAEETRTFAFTVADPLAVARRVDLGPRVLLWWNTGETPVARLEEVVAGRAASLDTVTAAAEFVAGLRSLRYNLFMIVGKDQALTAAEEAEVAAHVDAGAGLVASVYDKVSGPALGANLGGMGQSARDNVLGVHVAGLNGNDLVVEVPAGPLADAPVSFTAPGRADRVRVRHEAEILASFAPGAADSPAVTRRLYGAGRAVFVDFDAAKAVEGPDGTVAEEILGAVIDAAAPTEAMTTAGGTVRLAIDVASTVVNRDLEVNVEEVLPAGYVPTSIAPAPYAVQPGMIVWYDDLAAGETVAYRYSVEAPAGTSRPEAVVSYAVRGVYREQGRYGFDVTARSRADLAATAADSLAALADQQASPSDRNALEAAAAEVAAIKNAVFVTRTEAAAAIGDALDAIEAVTRTEDPDGRPVRDLLDALVRSLGREWCDLP